MSWLWGSKPNSEKDNTLEPEKTPGVNDELPTEYNKEESTLPIQDSSFVNNETQPQSTLKDIPLVSKLLKNYSLNDDDDKIVSLIGSHNSRIQCFLDNINPSAEKIRFQNCAIIRLEISDASLNLHLVYSGELQKGETPKKTKPYYSIEETGEAYKTYPNIIDKSLDESDFTKLKINKTSLVGKTYVFYIVRHGQGTHNIKSNSNWHMTYDTSVTDAGKSQAINAGKSLSGIKIVNWFSSDLLRTRETIAGIIKGMGPMINPPLEIVVLPCSHEVSKEGKTGNCDTLLSNASFARENIATKFNEPLEVDGKKIPIKWDIYHKFYNNGKDVDTKKTRTNPSYNRRHCQKTTMVGEAIEYIQTPVFNTELVGGNRRKSRKKQKSRKSRKSKKH